MGCRVVVHDLVAGWQDENLLLLVDSFPFGDQDLQIGEGFAYRVVAGLVAEGEGAIAVGEGGGGFDGDPLVGRLGHEVDLVDGGPVLLAVADL